MAVDQENVSKVLSVLSHKIRRQILVILCDKGESSFTDLMNALNIDTGKLSFHIRTLQPFLEQTENGKYKLSRAGEDAVRVVRDVESWAEVADVERKGTQLPLASFARRTAAFLVDFCIMFGLAVLLLIETVFSLFSGNWLLSLNVLFVTLGLLWVYSTLLEGFSGQSIGKSVLGIKVVQTNGRKLSYDHAAVRNFGKILLPFDLLFGYLLNDPRFIRYFDKFAGTTVINLRKHRFESKLDLTEEKDDSTPDQTD